MSTPFHVASLGSVHPARLHGQPCQASRTPSLTLSFGNRLMVLRGRSTRRTRRDLIVLMSFPLLLPLWRDVRVGRREERGRRSGWVVGGPQLRTRPPWSPTPAGRGWRAREQMAFCGSGSGLLKSPHHRPRPRAAACGGLRPRPGEPAAPGSLWRWPWQALRK